MSDLTTATEETSTRLTISFVDENVQLTGQVVVDGNKAAALAYAPEFEADLRRNNTILFEAAKTKEV